MGNRMTHSPPFSNYAIDMKRREKNDTVLYVNPFSNKLLTLFQTLEFRDDNYKFLESGGKLSERVKTLWKKEKLLVTMNFSFSS